MKKGRNHARDAKVRESFVDDGAKLHPSLALLLEIFIIWIDSRDQGANYIVSASVELIVVVVGTSLGDIVVGRKKDLIVRIVEALPFLLSLGHELQKGTSSMSRQAHSFRSVVKTGVPFTTFLSKGMSTPTGSFLVLLEQKDFLA